MKQQLLLLSLFVLSSTYISAQRERTQILHNVRGEYAIVLEYADITGREATMLAREAAKKVAIEEVCGSQLTIWNRLETSSAGDVYNSLSLRQINGEIIEFEIKEEGYYQSPTRKSETIFYCVADVKVKKGLDPDPQFSASISGIRGVYYDGDELDFSFTSSQKCYLQMFLMEDEEKGALLYPVSWETPIEFAERTAYQLSKYAECKYTLQTTKEKEVNRLVLVFTKTLRPFIGELNRQEIEEWMARIPNDQKFLYFAVIEIRNK